MFAAILFSIAIFHKHSLLAALVGLAAVASYKVSVTGFKAGPGLAGLAGHMEHEWVLLANLFLLLTGFAILAQHFDDTKIPQLLPNVLPDDWKGGVMLLAVIFILSAFLDNIAAAMIGGTIARSVFQGRVHVGYLAAIVAASNAGGSGSVVGDTTTTMMWIKGVSPLDVIEAYIAAFVALAIFAVPASLQQHRLQPIVKEAIPGIRISWRPLLAAAIVLASAISANVTANLAFPEVLDRAPVVGLAVWAAIVAAVPLNRPSWHVLPGTIGGTVFLLALVTAASMMPVEALPPATALTTLSLGFVSAVFDNIPLTALAINQGGYDWGYLAYAVGFGGSMVWFGSSAGVALSNLFPEAKSVAAWLRAGWHVPCAYVVGFLVMLGIAGWSP